MSERDPLAQRLDEAQRSGRATADYHTRAEWARSADLGWLFENAPAAFDRVVAALKNRIQRVADDIEVSHRRFVLQQTGARNLTVALGRDSILTVDYEYGDQTLMPPQIQATLSTVSGQHAASVRQRFDPAFYVAGIVWRSNVNVYAVDDLVDKLLNDLLNFDIMVQQKSSARSAGS